MSQNPKPSCPQFPTSHYLLAAVLLAVAALVELEEVDAERLERPPHLVQLRLDLLLLGGRGAVALPDRRQRARSWRLNSFSVLSCNFRIAISNFFLPCSKI